MTNHEEVLWPPKLDLQTVGIATLGSFVSWAIGGIFVLICTFFFLGATKTAAPTVFPYVLSLVGLIAILISLFIHFILQKMIFSESDKRMWSKFNHVFAFNLLTYILIMPIYVFVWVGKTEELMAVFTIHVVIASLGSILIVSVLSQYRYSILSVYSCFVWLIALAFWSVVFFLLASNSEQILFILSAIITLSITVLTFAKLFTEYVYYKIYTLSWQDMLWDALEEIAREETEWIREAVKSSTTFM